MGREWDVGDGREGLRDKVEGREWLRDEGGDWGGFWSADGSEGSWC